MLSSTADWDSLWKGGFSYGVLDGWAKAIFIAIADLLRDVERPRILSAGCGRGLIDYWLMKVLGYHVTLLDSSKQCIRNLRDYLREVDRSQYSLCHDSILSIPYPDRTFDLVWNAGVLEHFNDEEYILALGEMRRVSRKFVLVAVPHASCKPYLLSKQWLEESGRWTWGYEKPRSSLKDDFSQVGMRVLLETAIGGRVTIHNYLNMVPAEYRGPILHQLTDEDYEIFPHLLTIGEIDD